MVCIEPFEKSVRYSNQHLLQRRIGVVAQSSILEQFGQLRAFCLPFFHNRFSEQHIMPSCALAQIDREVVDAFTPCQCRSAFALHIRVADLLLRFGLDDKNGIVGAHQKVW